uniref:Uncharacterized protein n=1 Tax=Oryza sativa subsp. japonica TaxID=39947 RepID=Q69V37_ORYSJ|nr:hypothetical protein [Oryza sativa Japonica Group]BAD35641.1 hypothetical protein [Oryza sativa Japonica Group]
MRDREDRSTREDQLISSDLYLILSSLTPSLPLPLPPPISSSISSGSASSPLLFTSQSPLDLPPPVSSLLLRRRRPGGHGGGLARPGSAEAPSRGGRAATEVASRALTRWPGGEAQRAAAVGQRAARTAGPRTERHHAGSPFFFFYNL